MTESSLNTKFKNHGDANRPRATETNGRYDNGTGKTPQRISKRPRFLSR